MNIFHQLLIQPLANGLIISYKLLGGNMGLAIIGFSVVLRFLLSPLTKPYMESMKKMREVAPQLEKLKKKHSKDRMKLAQAQSELYRQKKINPGAGCLPYILQIVILIAFFNVFIKTLSPDGDPTSRFNELLYEPLRFSQQENINTKFLYLDITKPDVINIPSLPFSIPGPILILASLVQFLSTKVMNPYLKTEEKIVKQTPQESDDMQVAMQKSMAYTFPLFTLIIGLRFASGLALYWFIFSLTQMISQVRSQGWGELTPLLEKIKLIKSKT